MIIPLFQDEETMLNSEIWSILTQAKNKINQSGSIKIPQELVESINIEWSNARSWCGYAMVVPKGHNQEVVIKLSKPHFDSRTNEDNMETLVHEFCHIADWYIFGEMSGHGTRWKYLMKLAGYPNANRCARGTFIRPVNNMTLCYCNCERGVYLGKTRINRIKNGSASYKCKKCLCQVRLEK